MKLHKQDRLGKFFLWISACLGFCYRLISLSESNSTIFINSQPFLQMHCMQQQGIEVTISKQHEEVILEPSI